MSSSRVARRPRRDHDPDRCRVTDCKRRPQPDANLCPDHFALLVDRALRGQAPKPPAGRRWQDAGQALAEYALILTLIAIVAIVTLMFLGGQVQKVLSIVGGSV